MKMGELLWRGTVVGEAVDDLDEELVELLAGDGADFKMVETADEQFGDVVGDGGLRHV